MVFPWIDLWYWSLFYCHIVLVLAFRKLLIRPILMGCFEIVNETLPPNACFILLFHRLAIAFNTRRSWLADCWMKWNFKPPNASFTRFPILGNGNPPYFVINLMPHRKECWHGIVYLIKMKPSIGSGLIRASIIASGKPAKYWGEWEKKRREKRSEL
jgi:hypothetical protein